jgi:hypothetical protein
VLARCRLDGGCGPDWFPYVDQQAAERADAVVAADRVEHDVDIAVVARSISV